MFHRYCRALVVVGLIAATGWPASHLAAQVGSTPDLTGTWVLNAGLSDRPGQRGGGDEGDRPDGGGGRRGPGGGGMGRPGGGMGGGGFGGRGGGGGMPNEEEMERTRAALDAATRTPTRLIIVKGDPGLIVTDEEGVSTRLALNGGKETGAANGVAFESAAKWEDGKLRVEREVQRGTEGGRDLLRVSRSTAAHRGVEGRRWRQAGRSNDQPGLRSAGDGRSMRRGCWCVVIAVALLGGASSVLLRGQEKPRFKALAFYTGTERSRPRQLRRRSQSLVP